MWKRRFCAGLIYYFKNIQGVLTIKQSQNSLIIRLRKKFCNYLNINKLYNCTFYFVKNCKRLIMKDLQYAVIQIYTYI